MRAGDFDLELILIRRGMATLPLDRLDTMHPRARVELLAMFEAEAMLAARKKQQAERAH